MSGSNRKRQRLGQFWLWQRPGIGTWSICWLDRVGGRSVTRRKSVAARSDHSGTPPQEALDALAAHHVASFAPSKQTREVALVEALMAEWLRHHVAELAAPERYAYSVAHWIRFFDGERRAGRLTSGPTVADLTPSLQKRFRLERIANGAGGHTISRDLAALRGALRWAWKTQLIEHPPFVADVPAHQKAPARDRVLTFEELARILEACADRVEREHIIRFIVIELGTAGRPEAVLGLTDANVDLQRGLLDPNQPGHVHTRKRRPIVPIAEAVRPWLTGIEGKLIKYKVPIAERHRVTGGPTHFERDTSSIKTSWDAVCREAKVEKATPKTLRHTMLTWLAQRGVPKEQREMLAGHRPQGTTARNYEHLSPSYLSEAICEVDAFFVELRKHTTAHVRYRCDTPANPASAC
jgi:integrase